MRADMADVESLSELAKQLRLSVLHQSKRAHVGHIGSELSVVDILAALYGRVLSIADPDDPDRDRFVLSKGHAALTLYAALAAVGVIDREELDTYCGDESRLGVHPERDLPGIDFSTGSLGQGLSVAAGSALAARLTGSHRRTVALISDAECDEGSTWEAAMFAAHHQLASLVAIIDLNGQQALGYTNDVLSLTSITARWAAFGWDTHEVDGHDPEEIARTILSLSFESGPPHVLIAKTTFGFGVDFMESQIRWHYLPMSDLEFQSAIAQVSLMSA